MADKRKRPRKRRGGKFPKAARPRSRFDLDLRRVDEESAWQLVHPRCTEERAADLEEVQAMLEAGEIEVAIDELRWLLDGCGNFLEAHKILGELASADVDLELARGHFGHAYQIGLKAVRRLPPGEMLPYRLAPNRPFFEIAKGLVWCLEKLGRKKLAREVVEQMCRCDPSDPLGMRGLIE